MKTKKILFYTISIIWIVLLLSNNVFAIEEWSSWYEKLGSSVLDAIYTWMLKFITLAISILIGFMAWLMTFGILFLSYLMDMIFIKVPYIWDILWAQWDMVFINNVQKITTIVLVFSIFVWLFLWGFNYIKSVIEQITMWAQNWNRFNIAKDIMWKFFVVLLIFTIPFSLPYIFKWVNTISAWILKMEISAFDKEDQIIISSRPLTSLVELWIWLPAVDWISSEQDENNGKTFTSIHDRQNGDGIRNWNLEFKLIFKSIIEKSIFQFGRFTNLAMTISQKETLNNIVENNTWSTAKELEQQAEGHEEWLVIFLFISIFYIVMLYIIFMKLFNLFMALVTRFVNIIMSSMFLSFHLAMLGSENTKEFWKRNLWSFIWDILVTPLIAAFIWIAILILGFFASVIGTWDDSFIYFATWNDIEWYESVLFSWMLILAILYGILNKLNKVVEFVWANFENIISTKGGQGIQDSYATPWEAMDASGKVWGMWKKVGTMLWVAKAWAMMKWTIANKYNWDPIFNRLKEQAKEEWVKQANVEKLSEITLKTKEKYDWKWNNTKIN